MISVAAGDRITVTDVEGLQACEVVTADSRGRIAPSMLGVESNCTADGLKSVLAVATQDAVALRRGIARRGIDLAKARSVRLFGAGSPAESSSPALASHQAVYSCDLPVSVCRIFRPTMSVVSWNSTARPDALLPRIPILSTSPQRHRSPLGAQ
jgi:hypothetical protein